MKQEELREVLIMHADEHLYALQNSESYGSSESPSVYKTRGVLDGICIVTGINYTVEKRWKIIFLKKNGKPWFTYTLEDMTEEDADEIMEYRKRRQGEESELYSKIFC
ncbi:hypothetical protein [Paenibacillus periandrae]|uniref:hypothetical protein n=1 Tax=Paenibacillus periandrae TaxID=1761741 RepID=UPI001F09F012|nr:hypothetical protein [Paenibacillus periandrae]